jgi:hypothetical protein
LVYGGIFLFWKHADVSVAQVTLPVAILLAVMCVAVPLLGNFFPSRVSFLLAMRYYAGNWPFSIWLFRKGSHERLERLTKSSAWIYDQVARLYDPSTCVAMIGRVMGFRLMHLHGRLLAKLVPKAVEHFDEYDWIDGEMVAGMVLGWNFGDGHLHGEQLLRSVQKQCSFEPGELRCVIVEAQPKGRTTLHYRILDAKAGLMVDGQADVRELFERQPWG